MGALRSRNSRLEVIDNVPYWSIKHHVHVRTGALEYSFNFVLRHVFVMLVVNSQGNGNKCTSKFHTEMSVLHVPKTKCNVLKRELKIRKSTRKSSCMNARVILPAPHNRAALAGRGQGNGRERYPCTGQGVGREEEGEVYPCHGWIGGRGGVLN